MARALLLAIFLVAAAACAGDGDRSGSKAVPPANPFARALAPTAGPSPKTPYPTRTPSPTRSTPAPTAITPPGFTPPYPAPPGGGTIVNPPGSAPLPGEHCETLEPDFDQTGVWILDLETCVVYRRSQGTSDTVHDWSPDGSRLLISRLDEPTYQSNSELYILNASNGSTTRLTFTPGIREGFASWSPDGSRIAYEAPDGVKVVTVSGDPLFAFPSEFTGYFSLAWSPDSNKLASATESGLVVFDLQAGDANRLSSNRAWGVPQWSPDGSQIAYQCRDRPPEGFHNSINAICVTRPDGSDLRILAFSSSPSWSPDGHLLVPSGQQLYFLDPVTMEQRDVITAWPSSGSLSWISEGMAGSHRCTGPAAPCFVDRIVVELETGHWKTILSEGCGLGSRFSPTGRYLAYATGIYGVGCL
jgi:Tol biopolymer transport system component